MNKLKQFYQWLVTSSVNHDKFSLTLKAGLPFLILLGVGETEVTELIGEAGNLTGLIAQVVTGLLTLWGLARKIVLSVQNR